MIRSLLPNALWRVNTTNKEVFLTFDDGPTPKITTKVLAILDEFDAKASFFCIGKNVAEHPSIYESILEKGHTVGNHTQHHLKGWQTKLNNYIDDVSECAKLVNSNLFRPPYGRITRKQYHQLKETYKIVLWDVLSWDFKGKNTPEECANNVIKSVRPGSIIVFHDSKKAAKNCLGAVPIVLQQLSKTGYSFSALESSQGPIIS